MNGLDIAYLNGIGITSNRADAIKRYATNGYNDHIENEISLLTEGHDFRGVDWENPLDVEEAVHSQLSRTYGIVDKCPQLVSGYQDPAQFKKMLGYVLNNWDSANREQAIEAMAKEEERLIGIGAIQNNLDEEDKDTFYLEGDDIFDPEEMELAPLGAVKIKKTKRGLFNQLTKLNKPNLTADERKIVSANPLLANFKDKLRKQIAANRKTTVKAVRTNAGKVVKMLQKKATPAALQGLGAIVSENDDLMSVLMGTDLTLCGTTDNPQVDENALRNYLLRTHKVVSENPQEFFANKDEAQAALNAIGAVVANSNNIANFQSSIDAMLKDSGLKGLGGLGSALGDFLGKVKKKAAKATSTKKATKKTAVKTTTAKAATKTTAKTTAKTTKAQKKAAKKEAKVAKAAAKKGVTVEQYKQQQADKKQAKKEKKAKRKEKVKKVFKKIGNALKKVGKFLVKINPICLIMRGGLLLAMRLNLFKFAARLYPGSLSESEALKMGFTKEQYAKMKQAYEKSLKFYTKVGGKKATFDKILKSGSKRTYKGGETYSKDELKKAVTNNIDALKKDISAQEQQMKKDGVQFVSDPKVTYSETPVNGLAAALGAIDEMMYNPEAVEGLGALGALGEAITIATVTTTAGGTLASIGALLGKLGIKGDWIKKVANKVKQVVSKVKNSKAVANIKKAVSKTKDKVKAVKTTAAELKKQANVVKKSVKDTKAAMQKQVAQVKKTIQTATGQKQPTAQVAQKQPTAQAAQKTTPTTTAATTTPKATTQTTYSQKTSASAPAPAQSSVPATSQQVGSNNKVMIAGGVILALAAAGTFLYNQNKK